MFWNILQVAGVDRGQVGGPGALCEEHGMVQDGHDAHQTDQDEVGNVLEHTTGCWRSSETNQGTRCTTHQVRTWGWFRMAKIHIKLKWKIRRTNVLLLK
jgi:hypothetical protein